MIANYPYLDRNIPTYDIYISQQVRYARICSIMGNFCKKSKRLSSKLEKQGFNKKTLKKSFVKIYNQEPLRRNTKVWSNDKETQRALNCLGND